MKPHAIVSVRTFARFVPFALSLASSYSLTACATTAQHDSLVARVVVLERAEADRRRQLQTASDQLNTLTQQLEQARTQTRNLADQGARLDGFDETIRQLRGTLTELQRTAQTGTDEGTAARTALAAQLTALERRLTTDEQRLNLAPAVSADEIPHDPPAILQLAQTALDAHDLPRAQTLAGALVARAPTDPLVPAAHLVLARVEMQRTRTANALQEYRLAVQANPPAEVLQPALAEMADGYVRLGMCREAQAQLRTLTERYGSTPAGVAARRRADEVRRLPRASCTD